MSRKEFYLPNSCVHVNPLPRVGLCTLTFHMLPITAFSADSKQASGSRQCNPEKESPAVALGQVSQKHGPVRLSGATGGLLWFLLIWKGRQTLEELSVTNWQPSIPEIVFLPGLSPATAVWLPGLSVADTGMVSQLCCCRLWADFSHLSILFICNPESYIVTQEKHSPHKCVEPPSDACFHVSA